MATDGDGLSDLDEVDYPSDPLLADSDGDGLLDGEDNCPDVTGSDPFDRDTDDIGDCCDNCPVTPNRSQTDQGGLATFVPDGVGDVCQNADFNGDGVVDILDVTLLRRALIGLEPALGNLCRTHPRMLEQCWGAILMEKQQTFASAAWNRKGKVTRREQFLAEMNAVIPWPRLLKLISPYYHQGKTGRVPHDLERMLRIYFMQQWFNLSDPQAEDAIYDSESMRRFARVELGEDRVPDESTILRFRHLLEKHGLTESMFEAVKDLLAEHRLTLRAGTIVDATIIAAPSSTKNATKSRDPEMKQTRKGQSWHFGMKLHIGTDRRGIVHSLTATHAAEADIKQLPNLLHGDETVLYGDQAYWKEADRKSFEENGVRYRVNRRAAGGNKNLNERWRKINRARSRTRARCEHRFRVIKTLWGFDKTRYRGIAKNLARAQTMFALANLYVLRQKLMPPGHRCAL